DDARGRDDLRGRAAGDTPHPRHRLHARLGLRGGPGAGPWPCRGGRRRLGLCAGGAAPRARLRRRPRAARPRLADEGPMSELQARLETILRAAPSLMTVMRIARDLDLPDWLIVSGAVYQRVWNHQTGRDPDYGIRDYDLVYFDPDTT